MLYKYIHAPSHHYDPLDVIETIYKSTEDLLGKFVVYSGSYKIYDNVCMFHQYLYTLPQSARLFHEVIFNIPQKLKFDIDAEVVKMDDFMIDTNPDCNFDDIDALLDSIQMPKMKYDNIFATILDTIRDAFFIVYEVELKESNIIICESHDPSGKKYSNHIIIDGYYVSDVAQAKEFTRRLCEYLPTKYKKFLDVSVNKNIQNFRVAGCHKGDNRIKTIVSGQDPSRTYITDVSDCVLLDNIGCKKEREEIQLHPDEITRVLEICQRSGIDDHKFKFVRNGIFIFQRIRASHCEFCCRTHDADNTLFVSTCTNNGAVSVFKHCRKYADENGPGSGVCIGEIIAETPPEIVVDDQRGQERKNAGWVDTHIIRTIETPSRIAPGLFDGDTFSKHIYEEPYLRPFELTDTLVVHAMMKMGKTKALHDYITKNFPDGLRTPVIRFVSFRQTFSGNIKEKFTDFTLYSDVRGPLDQPKLIVQVESLWRLDIREGVEAPDLVILDECESIFEQFDSGLLRNFTESFCKFQYLLKYSKHVVCMDANISNRTYNVLQRLRPRNMLYHCNQYKNAREDKYYLTGDKLKWLGLLYSTIDADERVSVPMSSLSEAKILVKNLSKRFPEKRVKLYSSETPMSEKREHFADVNAYWSQYDILVYTPTVSAGVSFEQKHFAKIFGYFTDQSCPVETCIQMIGRIRDVADKQFYICVAATGNNLPTGTEEIKRYVFEKRDNFTKEFDHTGLTPEYGPNGEVQYHTSDYFHLWLENTRIKNLSKNSFTRRLIDVICFTGANVEYFTDELFEFLTGIPLMTDGIMTDELEDLNDAHRTARLEIREDICKKISQARDIDEQEVDEIHNAMVAQTDISDSQKYAFEKHRLRIDYKFEGVIDEKFVDKYRDPKTRRIFKNITRISACESTENALKQIQAEEAANHLFIMGLNEKYHHQDINRKYVFDQHRYALGLLKLCGWKHITDPQFIHKITLACNLRDNEKVYWDSIGSACVEFQLRTPRMQLTTANKTCDDRYIELMMKPVNKILSIMYGINLRSNKSDPDMFYLAHNTMFTFDPTRSLAKSIPLITPPKRTVDAL